MKIVKEGLVVERVGRLQYDGWQEEIKEEFWGELWKITVEVGVLHQNCPHHSNDHQQTAGKYTSSADAGDKNKIAYQDSGTLEDNTWK